jgi:hypothetical protein
MPDDETQSHQKDNEIKTADLPCHRIASGADKKNDG